MQLNVYEQYDDDARESCNGTEIDIVFGKLPLHYKVRIFLKPFFLIIIVLSMAPKF